MYKSFLQPAVSMSKIRRLIKSFNGDGVLAVFDGRLEINNAVPGWPMQERVYY